MPVADVVCILRELLEDGDAAVARRHGPRALDVAQSLRTALIGHLKAETPFAALWRDFEEDPADTEAELTGALEATVEGDAALAQTLDQYSREYYQLIGPPEARIPEEDRRRPGPAVSTEEDEPAREPPEAEVRRKTTYLYNEVRAGTVSVGREVDEDREEDTVRPPISSLGPDAGTAGGVFKELYAAIDAYPDLSLELRTDLKATVKAIEEESDRGDEASADGLERYLRDVRESAPDLLELFLTVLTDPEAELNPVLRRAAQRL